MKYHEIENLLRQYLDEAQIDNALRAGEIVSGIDPSAMNLRALEAHKCGYTAATSSMAEALAFYKLPKDVGEWGFFVAGCFSAPKNN